MKTNFNISNVFIISMLCLVLSMGCSNKKTSNSENKTLSGTINIDGSSTVYPVTEAVVEEYRTKEPNIKITVGISGTGGGFQKFLRGEIHISNASRPIKESEIEIAKKENIKYRRLSVAYDGMAVLVHPQNNWVDYLTVDELNKIWCPDAQDNIKYWNQIRSDWPRKELHLYGPGTASGTYDYFAEVICGKKVGTRGDYTASENDNVLVQGISGDQDGLGFMGLGYYSENAEKLKLIPIDNGNGNKIIPTLETVKNGSYNPLSRPLYIYVNGKVASAPHVEDFVLFYLDQARKLVTDVGYIPLTDEQYKEQKDIFETFVKSLTP